MLQNLLCYMYNMLYKTILYKLHMVSFILYVMIYIYQSCILWTIHINRDYPHFWNRNLKDYKSLPWVTQVSWEFEYRIMGLENLALLIIPCLQNDYNPLMDLWRLLSILQSWVSASCKTENLMTIKYLLVQTVFSLDWVTCPVISANVMATSERDYHWLI